MRPEAAAVLDVIAGRLPRVEGEAAATACALLRAHGLAGLAVSELRGRAGGGVVEALLDAHRVQAFHTTLVLESGERAVSALEAAGVAALPFKGMGLLRAGVYRDPGARAMEDVDLLVEADRVEPALRALEGAGFRPWTPWEPSRREWLASIALADEAAPPGVPAAVDLHWATPYTRLRLSGPWPRDPLWEGAIGGVPAPEPHFVVIAEHLLKHLRVVRHLRGVADLVRLSTHLADPPLLVDHARRRGSLPGLRIVLAFLTEGLEIALPAGVLEAVGPDARARAAARRYLNPERLVVEAGVPGAVEGLVGAWGLVGSRRATLVEWLRVGFPPPRWLRARYPRTHPARRRARYLGSLVAWAAGLGPSPLIPSEGGGAR